MQYYEQSVGGFLGTTDVRLIVYRQNCRTPLAGLDLDFESVAQRPELFERNVQFLSRPMRLLTASSIEDY